MDLLPTPGGVSATARPPEVVILDIDPSLVDNTAIDPALVVNGDNEDNNGNDNTVRHSRSDERSPSTDGGARRHSTSDDLRKQSFRMASAEREKKRKRDAKEKEENFFEAFSGIVRECKTANIATNPHLIQMRCDVKRTLEIQEDHKLALASLGAAMNRMSLQMDQFGTKLENLKSGDVSLSDTEGLQNCLEGLHQKMREDVTNCIHSATTIPPSKKPRLGELPGRRPSASDENHIESVEMTDVSTDAESETDAPIGAAPGAAPAKSKQGKLFSPRQRREIDHEARLQAETRPQAVDRQNSKSYAEVAKPSGGRQNDQPKKRAPRNRGRRGQSSGDRESDNNNGSNDDGRRGDRSRSKNRDNSRGRDKSPKYVKKTYQVINDDKGYNFMESEVEWIKIESKTKNQKRRQNKRFKISEESSDKEVILHNIPTLDRAGVPETAEADADRAIKVLRELQRGGYTLKNGHITGTERQVRNNRNKGFQPITISLKDGDIADDIKLAASKVGLLDARDPKTNDSAEDNIGYLRKSLSEEERKKIGATKRFFESKAGKALKQIRKRQYDSTTNASAWSKINVELGVLGPVAAGQTKPPVIEKPEATRAALRLLAETGSEAAETLLKELAAAEAANKKQDNHENNTDF
jgi:hypothetical protein